jgi:hypothetical protein
MELVVESKTAFNGGGGGGGGATKMWPRLAPPHPLLPCLQVDVAALQRRGARRRGAGEGATVEQGREKRGRAATPPRSPPSDSGEGAQSCPASKRCR